MTPILPARKGPGARIRYATAVTRAVRGMALVAMGSACNVALKWLRSSAWKNASVSVVSRVGIRYLWECDLC